MVRLPFSSFMSAMSGCFHWLSGVMFSNPRGHRAGQEWHGKRAGKSCATISLKAEEDLTGPELLANLMVPQVTKLGIEGLSTEMR